MEQPPNMTSIVRYKQQRLLLLRHASKCHHKEGTCPVTRHCPRIKALWNHLLTCRNQHCTVKHCISSRYVLSHYRKCTNQDCPTCGPVRVAIQKQKKRSANQAQLETRLPNDTSRFTSLPKRQKTDTSFNDNRFNDTPVAVVSPTKSVLLNDVPTERLVMDSNLQAKCNILLTALKVHKHGWVFLHPVDPVALEIPDYFTVIAKPMDLGTIEQKLNVNGYRTVLEFKEDVCLTFDNAMTYNQVGSVVYEMAKELKHVFLRDFTKTITVVASDHKNNKVETQNDGPLEGNLLRFDSLQGISS